MTAQELISGLRERGFNVIRYQDHGRVIVPRLDGDSPFFGWLQEIGVQMIPYRLSTEVPTTYEADLTRAQVEGDIWEAAA